MRRAFAVILLLLTLTGCERTARWQEHVQLSDGTVLVVDRAVHFERRGQIGSGSAWVPIDERLDFKDPASGISLAWQSPYRIAGVVDRVDGQFWVFARLTTDCLAGFVGRSRWMAFVWDGQQWQPVEADAAPVRTVPNLLVDAHVYGVASVLRKLDLADKARLDERSQSLPDVRSIDLRTKSRC